MPEGARTATRASCRRPRPALSQVSLVGLVFASGFLSACVAASSDTGDDDDGAETGPDLSDGGQLWPVAGLSPGCDVANAESICSLLPSDSLSSRPELCPEFWSGIELQEPFWAVLGYLRHDADELVPWQAVDWLEVRYGTDGEELSTVGTPCSGATDVQACEAQLADLPLPDPPLVDGQPWLRWTRGESAGQAMTEEAIAAFLAPVDSLEEALLLAQTNPRFIFWGFSYWGPLDLRSGAWTLDSDGTWHLIVHDTLLSSPAVWGTAYFTVDMDGVVRLQRTAIYEASCSTTLG